MTNVSQQFSKHTETSQLTHIMLQSETTLHTCLRSRPIFLSLFNTQLGITNSFSYGNESGLSDIVMQWRLYRRLLRHCFYCCAPTHTHKPWSSSPHCYRQHLTRMCGTHGIV